jgi:hypothetical protein
MEEEESKLRFCSVVDRILIKRSQKGVGFKVLKQDETASIKGQALSDRALACAQATVNRNQHPDPLTVRASLADFHKRATFECPVSDRRTRRAHR